MNWFRKKHQSIEKSIKCERKITRKDTSRSASSRGLEIKKEEKLNISDDGIENHKVN